tara:strand:- start:127 stop:1068 length:942 start_codon:yes stop_codon:yes gene_type:complete
MPVTQVSVRLRTIFLLLLALAFSCAAVEQDLSLEGGYHALASEDYSLAYRTFNKLAREGEAEALFPLALFYQRGWGKVREDIDKACALFFRAARADIPKAQQEYGHCIIEGYSNPSVNPVVWLERAYQNGIYEAACDIGRLYLGSTWQEYDVGKALLWCHKAAEKSALKAQVTLGDIYFQLSEFDQAEFWYQQAINSGSGESAFKLATLYLKAVEVAPNTDYPSHKALYLMELASSYKVEQAYIPTAQLYWKKLRASSNETEALLAKSYLWAKTADIVNSTKQTQRLLFEIQQELPKEWKRELDLKVEMFLNK